MLMHVHLHIRTNMYTYTYVAYVLLATTHVAGFVTLP